MSLNSMRRVSYSVSLLEAKLKQSTYLVIIPSRLAWIILALDPPALKVPSTWRVQSSTTGFDSIWTGLIPYSSRMVHSIIKSTKAWALMEG